MQGEPFLGKSPTRIILLTNGFHSDKNPVSDHQVILLKLLDSKIHAHQKEQTFPTFIQHEELEFLTVQLNLIGKEALRVIVQVKENASQLQPDQIANVYTAIVLLLQILNELFVLDEDHGQGAKSLLVNADALTLVTGKKRQARQPIKLAHAKPNKRHARSSRDTQDPSTDNYTSDISERGYRSTSRVPFSQKRMCSYDGNNVL